MNDDILCWKEMIEEYPEEKKLFELLVDTEDYLKEEVYNVRENKLISQLYEELSNFVMTMFGYDLVEDNCCEDSECGCKENENCEKETECNHDYDCNCGLIDDKLVYGAYGVNLTDEEIAKSNKKENN